MRHYKDFHLGEKKKRQEKNKAKLDPKPEVIEVEEGESENENDEEEDGDEEEDENEEDENEEGGDVEEDGVKEEEELKAKPKTYDCPVCDKVYTNANSLWAHKKTKHPELGQVPASSKVTKVPGEMKRRKSGSLGICGWR